MKFTIEDLPLLWSSFTSFRFVRIFPKENNFVYKLAQAKNPRAYCVLTTQFFSIFEVTNENMTTPVGYIFMGLDYLEATFKSTSHALVGTTNSTSYTLIKSSGRTSPWSTNAGLSLINYDNHGEVITDLGSIMGISLLK